MPRNDASPVSVSEAKALFADLSSAPALLVAVSGGPDSTALLYLLARWRAGLKNGPRLIACTIDHRLRKESAAEAKAVGRLARKLKVPHRILHWRGKKPASGLQQAARLARYRLLADVAAAAKARHILTAHTLDDQAETVLLRLTRGSGLTGLSGMARIAPLPVDPAKELVLVRPFLSLRKARLLSTLKRGKVAFADDPSNRNPKFTRVRLRQAAALLEGEGLSAQRLSLLARRMRRAESAIEAMVESALRTLQITQTKAGVGFAIRELRALPEEVVLRLVGRTIAAAGAEGPVELGKLEALLTGLFEAPAGRSVRRTLAGALVTRRGEVVEVERAPRRRSGRTKPAGFRP
jgi:tRNA(Ile)-lysidine synthase